MLQEPKNRKQKKKHTRFLGLCRSVAKLSQTLQPHQRQHTRLPCPSVSSRVCSSSCSLKEKTMAPYSSTLAWKIPGMEEPGGLQSMGSLRIGHNWATYFTFHFHALEKEMTTHSSVLAWRIPGMGEPGGLLSVGSHRVGHDWSDLTAACSLSQWCCLTISSSSASFYSCFQSFSASRSFLELL